MNKLEIQRTIGEEFISWADMYFTEANQGKEIDRKEMYDNFLEYIGPARRSFYSPMGFKARLIKYCELRNLIFNPQCLDLASGEYIIGSDGYPSVKHDGREYFTVERAIHYIKGMKYPKVPFFSPRDLISPADFTFVDLGLPSGRLWATTNAPGHYNHQEALDTFGDYLPKAAAMAELIEECQVTWNPETCGLDLVGPNGNTLFLPADGYYDPWDKKVHQEGYWGEYWTRKTNPLASQASAYNLSFRSGNVGPLDDGARSLGFAVRPSRELK